MNRLITLACVTTLAAGALVGCGAAPEPGPGVVVGRDYDPGHVKTTGSGKKRKSTYKAADWDITIKQDTDGQEVEWPVPQSVYDACQVQARWPDCKPK